MTTEIIEQICAKCGSKWKTSKTRMRKCFECNPNEKKMYDLKKEIKSIIRERGERPNIRLGKNRGRFRVKNGDWLLGSGVSRLEAFEQAVSRLKED